MSIPDAPSEGASERAVDLEDLACSTTDTRLSKTLLNTHGEHGMRKSLDVVKSMRDSGLGIGRVACDRLEDLESLSGSSNEDAVDIVLVRKYDSLVEAFYGNPQFGVTGSRV